MNVENTEMSRPLELVVFSGGVGASEKMPEKEETKCWEIECPIEFAWKFIGRKWSMLILRELFDGVRRPQELLEALPGISSKTLTARLRELEKYGLLERTVYSEVPPRVEYSLTQKGQELKPVLVALKQVGEQWLQDGGCVCPLGLSG